MSTYYLLLEAVKSEDLRLVKYSYCISILKYLQCHEMANLNNCDYYKRSQLNTTEKLGCITSYCVYASDSSKDFAHYLNDTIR